MKRQRKIWVLLGLILVVGVVARALMPKEPTYEGKTVKEWFNAMDVKPTGVNQISIGPASASYTAMIGMKQATVPFLLKEIKKTNSNVHRRLYSWLNSLSGDYIMSDEEREIRVLQCFDRIGFWLKDSIPELVEMAHSSKYENLARRILRTSYPEDAAKAGIN